MKTRTMREPWFSMALFANRLALGGLFLLAGAMKIHGGVGEFVRGPYSQTTPAWLPGSIATPYGYALPWLETLAGVLLILGLLGRLGAAIASLLLLTIIIAVGVQGPTGPVNVVLLTLSLLLLVAGSGGLSVDALLFRNKSET